MARTDLGYLDGGLWDDAGTVEAGPWVSTTAHPGGGGGGGAAVLRARLAARGGGGYWNPGSGVVSTNRYDFEAFGRFTSEASVRSQLLGVRLFAGADLGNSNPGRQRRSSPPGAHPHRAVTHPFLPRPGGPLG